MLTRPETLRAHPRLEPGILKMFAVESEAEPTMKSLLVWKRHSGNQGVWGACAEGKARLPGRVRGAGAAEASVRECAGCVWREGPGSLQRALRRERRVQVEQAVRTGPRRAVTGVQSSSPASEATPGAGAASTRARACEGLERGQCWGAATSN